MTQPTPRSMRGVLSSAYALLSSVAFWQRPQVKARAPVHAVVIPSGMTEVRLEVYGWGWVRVSAMGSPHHAPLCRNFVWNSGSVLALKVPVDKRVTVIARNFWGRARIRFEVAPTQRVLPSVPLQEMPRPVCAQEAHLLRVSMSLRGLRPVGGVRIGSRSLTFSRRINWYRPVPAYAPSLFANGLARMSDGVRQAVSAIDADMDHQIPIDTTQ